MECLMAGEKGKKIHLVLHLDLESVGKWEDPWGTELALELLDFHLDWESVGKSGDK